MAKTNSLPSSLMNFEPQEFSPIRWNNGALELLDQRLLPHQIHWVSYQDAPSVAQAITDMVVRGAPAIGITAAYGVALSAMAHRGTLSSEDLTPIMADITLLSNSRPTAINLMWALDHMKLCLLKAVAEHTAIDAIVTALIEEAISIHQQDIHFCHSIGDHGADLLSPNSTVYTHCNAGALATGGHGTALGVIRSAFAQDKISQVFAGETRPWLQGARLTSWELQQAGIPVRLVTEGAAGHTLKHNSVDWLIVGADRIAADGSVANKVGTYNLAILARHHNCKVMVAAPSSTFDLTIHQGDDIPIEQRADQEVTHYQDIPIAPEGVSALNPSFDVTPADLIDAIVTEHGVIERPNREKIAAHFDS